MNCNYCKNRIIRNLSLREIWLPKRIVTEQLCLTCLQKFKKLTKMNRCLGCFGIAEQEYCFECLRWKKLYPNYSFHHEALFSYNQAMQEWFQEYKFKGNYLLRYSFSPMIKEYFKQKKKVTIVPIPISEKRIVDRGFNQVNGLLLGAGLYFCELLVRVKDDKAQVLKNRKERLLLKQPFDILKKETEKITNQSVIIVDDIYTTGRTLFHAADIILKYEPSDLYTFSLAR